MKKNGFTLVEIVVVLGVTGVVIVSMVGIMVQSFRAKSRLSWSDEIEAGGTWVMDKLRNGILDASGDTITCGPVGSDTFTYVSLKGGGEITTVLCDDDGASTGIASNSANLLKDNLQVTNCSTFVSCDTLPVADGGYRVTKVDLSFDLSADPALVPTTSPDYVSRTFQTSVVVRN
jgi:prepilin-type N-terminal cleavage/methylation domain-containing protein